MVKVLIKDIKMVADKDSTCYYNLTITLPNSYTSSDDYCVMLYDIADSEIRQTITKSSFTETNLVATYSNTGYLNTMSEHTYEMQLYYNGQLLHSISYTPEYNKTYDFTFNCNDYISSDKPSYILKYGSQICRHGSGLVRMANS